MKINENYLLKKIAGKNIVVPVGEAAKNLNGMITLKNDSSLYLWECFKEDTTAEAVAKKISEEFGLDIAVAAEHVKKFVEILKPYGVFGE